MLPGSAACAGRGRSCPSPKVRRVQNANGVADVVVRGPGLDQVRRHHDPPRPDVLPHRGEVLIQVCNQVRVWLVESHYALPPMLGEDAVLTRAAGVPVSKNGTPIPWPADSCSMPELLLALFELRWSRRPERGGPGLEEHSEGGSEWTRREFDPRLLGELLGGGPKYRPAAAHTDAPNSFTAPLPGLCGGPRTRGRWPGRTG